MLKLYRIQVLTFLVPFQLDSSLRRDGDWGAVGQPGEPDTVDLHGHGWNLHVCGSR